MPQLAGTCKKRRSPSIIVGGADDHVHILCMLSREESVSESHHRQESFQDEFRRLLRKYTIEYDERYVWD
jgi:hypothetical protein